MKAHLISILALFVLFVTVGHTFPQPEDGLAAFQGRDASLTVTNERDLPFTSAEPTLVNPSTDGFDTDGSDADESDADESDTDSSDTNVSDTNGPTRDLAFQDDASSNTTLPLDDDNLSSPEVHGLGINTAQDLCEGYCKTDSQNCNGYCGHDRHRTKKCGKKKPCRRNRGMCKFELRGKEAECI
ncbi:hypothetical protein BO70DRAFT_45612 [Aspergillus heteromorphus CBS 117.55]|uniref:Dickkopf N-terminal cysteine-rich domain-containing protein n=1 Tax=Aspergillus heteromorphus CBS 117.55 TaxID=1448321 RepID=A0A317W6C3_9EURO|nr:uncharacterized protein BO70DRAFT_45612 [Aspergillus heteromorphus CBS 117.55]PWY80558.1 hypothetical protein BO70DRAFT_45612 [Aspergillus heteromorphus CBS 117.55]